MSSIWRHIIEPSGIPVTIEDLDKFECALKFELPNDYRNFLLSFNGGKVVCNHDIWIPEISCNIAVNRFLPLKSPAPSIGLMEARRMQERGRLCLRQAIDIGDDGGTGFFYLILAGEMKGSVHFIWKEDREEISLIDWDVSQARVPSDMVLISPNFDSLGELIAVHGHI